MNNKGKRNALTQSELKEILHYDPETGVFSWAKDQGLGKPKARSRAGTLSDGYVRISINRRIYLAHRLAWLYMTGRWPKHIIDHIDTNRSNNCFSNLREANISANACNSKLPANNTSGVKGVFWHKSEKKWCAKLGFRGKQMHLGYFYSLDEAKAAIEAARFKIHGEYANSGVTPNRIACVRLTIDCEEGEGL